MKPIIRRVILILLIGLLLAGAWRFGPQLRFAFDLYTGRYGDAELIYGPSLATEDCDRWVKVDEKIRAYMDRKLDGYYQGKLSYEDMTSLLSDMDQYQLFHPYAVRCIRLVEEMETARADLARADEAYAREDYADAIPLYRGSLIADSSAAARLELAQTAYRKQILSETTAAMDAGRYEEAEQALEKGRALLGDDDEDLLACGEDVRRLKREQAYSDLMDEARRALQTDGPEEAIRFMADQRQKSPEAYEIEYMEQVILHECEEQMCAQALSLKDAGDLDGSCAILEEGLRWIDSPKMKTLLAEIRGSIVYLLTDMPIQRDETSSLRTGAASTVAVDQVLQDALSNEYSHSLSADTGDVVLILAGKYSMFSGTVAFPKGEKSDIYRSSATLQVFGDGALLGEFRTIDSASSPLPFDIPVDGVQELTLRWISEGAGGWKDWGRFATIFDGRFLAAAP